MSTVAEELQLELEPQYNNEKIIPEAQLLERPLDIINSFQQAASEGIVPQVADAISLAHLPNPGFKITHEINPNAQIEPNDGKAVIVAGICGVTKSCEDRCCPIGDLDKARVRVGLINELKLNDPDFFNNPNADKIIKDRVNEIMEQKQKLASPDEPILTTHSSEEQTDTPTKDEDLTEKEEQKKKTEIPIGFFGRKLSPQEAEQRMKELSGTYSQGKKISIPETEPAIPEKKDEALIIENPRTITIIPAEQIIIIPEEIQSQPLQEKVIPDVPQERIERHRAKIELPLQQHVSQPTLEKPLAIEKPEPIFFQNEPKENDRNTSFVDLSDNNQTINSEAPKQQPTTIIQQDSSIEIPQRVTHTIELDEPEKNQQHISLQTEQIIMSTQANESVSRFKPNIPQSISFTEKILIQNQEIVTQQLESTFTLPTTEIPVVINQEPAEQLTEQLISSIAEKIVITGHSEATLENSTKPLEEVVANSEANEIKKPTVLEQKDTGNINPDEDAFTVFSYSETITPSSELPIESDVIVPPDIVIEPTTQPLQAITEIQMDDIPLTEQVLEMTPSDDQIDVRKPLESTENVTVEITQPASQEIFTQLLSTLISDTANTTPDIQPEQSQNDQTSVDQFIVETEISESHQVEIDVPVSLKSVVIIESSLQDLPQSVKKHIQQIDTPPLIVLAIPQLHEVHAEPTEQIVELETISETSVEQTDEFDLKENKAESFILHMLNQEELLNFVYLVQQITDVVTFLHSFNNDSDSTEPMEEEEETNVTPKELKNNTFGQYDDTVVITVWPIIQFMLYIQGMNIYLPQKSQLTTVT